MYPSRNIFPRFWITPVPNAVKDIYSPIYCRLMQMIKLLSADNTFFFLEKVLPFSKHIFMDSYYQKHLPFL